MLGEHLWNLGLSRERCGGEQYLLHLGQTSLKSAVEQHEEDLEAVGVVSSGPFARLGESEQTGKL